MEQFLFNNHKGQTILEVVVALGAGIIVLSAMTIAVVTALNNASQATAESQATQFAQQGIEIVRSMRNTDYATLSTLSGDYCMAASCSALTTQTGTCGFKTTSCGTNINNKFIREVSVTQNSSTCLVPGVTPAPGSKQTEVTMTVSWSDSKCRDEDNRFCHNVSIDTCLSNYTGRTAP
jgi:hypothetical protein